MRFSTRLILLFAIPALLLATALGISLRGIWKIDHNFHHYIDASSISTELQSLYAQGLQGSQALGNIVLDSADQQARQTLQAANDGFERTHAKLASLAQGTAQAGSI